MPTTYLEKKLPIRRLTRLLANLQTTIVTGGMRCFDGDVDRFVIFSLIVGASLQRDDRLGAISMHSVALSLNRPFETVRRHVQALIADGYCMRVSGGVTVASMAWGKANIKALLLITHDAFVRFVVDCAASGEIELPPGEAGHRFTERDGVQAAVDVLLGILDSNRAVHLDAVDLVLFSTVLHANATRYEEDPAIHTQVERGPESFDTAHAVRQSAVARALNMPETTVRRRLARTTGVDQAILSTPRGLIVSARWMERPDAREVSERSGNVIRRIFGRAAAAGFPFQAPATAYRVGRPPATEVF